MLRLMLAAVVALTFAACDAAEQNIEWEPGNSLTIIGPIPAGKTTSISGTVMVPIDPANPGNSTVHFYVRGFNKSKTYTWKFNGQTTPSLQDGEFTSVELPASTPAGTYTIEVSNGQFSGKRNITVAPRP